MQDTVFSPTLKVENGKLLRSVDNIEEIEKIIDVINKKGLFGKSIVNTKIFSREEKLVEHELLKYIIHSGEYTESMGYDIQKTCIDMCLDFLKDKIYSWDLLPHNYTYNNGQWFLYDFGALDLNPQNVKTEIRGFFKITFSNFEILRLLPREEMSYYYLTRLRIEDIIKLIPFHRWLILAITMSICLTLENLKQYKLAYIYIKILFKIYTWKYKKEYYNYEIANEEEKIYKQLNSEFEGISNAFCIGEDAAKWAIFNEESTNKINKFAYIDNYNLCDKYYNYIYKKQLKNISTAVLYPLVDDNKITETQYRALYDTYAQTRFYSEAVISFDFDNVEILSRITENILCIKTEKDIKDELNKYFDEVKVQNNLYIAKGKKDKTKPTPSKKYKDGNRGPDAIRQTWEIQKLIQEKQKSITKN